MNISAKKTKYCNYSQSTQSAAASVTSKNLVANTDSKDRASLLDPVEHIEFLLDQLHSKLDVVVEFFDELVVSGLIDKDSCSLVAAEQCALEMQAIVSHARELTFPARVSLSSYKPDNLAELVTFNCESLIASTRYSNLELSYRFESRLEHLVLSDTSTSKDNLGDLLSTFLSFQADDSEQTRIDFNFSVNECHSIALTVLYVQAESQGRKSIDDPGDESSLQSRLGTCIESDKEQSNKSVEDAELNGLLRSLPEICNKVLALGGSLSIERANPQESLFTATLPASSLGAADTTTDESITAEVNTEAVDDHGSMITQQSTTMDPSPQEADQGSTRHRPSCSGRQRNESTDLRKAAGNLGIRIRHDLQW